MKRAATASGERRQRARSSTQGTDLPEIPGVPPDLTPLMVESLRSSTKFFQHTTSSPFTPFHDDEVTSTQQQQSVVESILNRMGSDEETKTKRKRKDRMEEDRQSWLNAVKRRVRDAVPLSCFRYLWDLQQEHKRVAVRRASLYLCGALLQKSSECRQYVSVDDNLLQWVTCVVEAPNVKATDQQTVAYWQTEALEWLTHLSQEYGDLYPKLRVAEQFLEQRCPKSVHIDETTTNSSMPDLRRTRDIAMKYGDKELEKVEKLIRRAHDCLDVLVPRIGDDASPDNAAASFPRGSLVAGDDDDDDDDDIEWEEGDEEVSEGFAEDHVVAVERTLSAMGSSGGLQGGTLEIDLGREDEDTTDMMDENVRKCLQKTVQSIEVRHMKRISSWVDALIKADGLTLNGTSLVVMSVDESRRRGKLLQKFFDAKQTLASILASAARLGITTNGGDSEQTHLQTEQRVPANIPPQRQRAVLAAAARRRSDNRVSGRRSTKLQIKYRTS